MNEENRLIVREFKGKIAKLMNQYNLLENEMEQLKTENLGLREQIKELEQVEVNLVNELENLKIAKIFASGYGDNQEAKQKINKLLREIDNCIALLNR